MSSDPVDGGTPGSVDLSCTGDAELSVSAPQDNGSTSDLLATANFSDAFAEFGTGTTMTGTSSGGGPAFMPGPVDETISVGMVVDAGNPIPEGAYNYNVVVTATPL